ncbi:uncharacterized protein FOMMEDRAFT_157324 [Fomitiporia mediterranea MF3/22]|uniref:uncharacterized protein n=1 Tax=Fomitiporia mediterranea (strain MF3/22) TaxID=694068 RepID=UPI0004408F60|nr:uncharacterized protein FOMMEDRAFT_157324 [Fomitiporia mediterranea MF3/22]EJD02132.1 hypothetical protein FOMMEDRAFT_157324 [Fomitiporia mediterranea MF3/22]
MEMRGYKKRLDVQELGPILRTFCNITAAQCYLLFELPTKSGIHCRREGLGQAPPQYSGRPRMIDCTMPWLRMCTGQHELPAGSLVIDIRLGITPPQSPLRAGPEIQEHDGPKTTSLLDVDSPALQYGERGIRGMAELSSVPSPFQTMDVDIRYEFDFDTF